MVGGPGEAVAGGGGLALIWIWSSRHVGCPRVVVGFWPVPSMVGRGGQEKALCFGVGGGSACGCRVPLGAPPWSLPSPLTPRVKTMSASADAAAHGVVTFLEASSLSVGGYRLCRRFSCASPRRHSGGGWLCTLVLFLRFRCGVSCFLFSSTSEGFLSTMYRLAMCFIYKAG